MVMKAHKIGLVFALLLGGWHLLWAVLVASGWAQKVADFIFWMHFIKPVYVIEPFELARSAILIAITAVIGYVVGYVLAALWNWMHERAAL
jgi:hypothetical protein